MSLTRPQRLLILVTNVTLFVAGPVTGSRKDLDNLDKIGHRHVAHRADISPEKEAEIGKKYAAQYEQRVEIIQDAKVQNQVTKLAEKVVRNSDWKGPVCVKIVKSDEFYSFSLPGGLIYLTSGFLDRAESEDEIASAIAHQVAHAAARHWAAEINKLTLLQMALIPFPWLPAPDNRRGCAGFWVRTLDRTAPPAAFLKSQRHDEWEADYLALQYLYTAGYDPNAYVRLLRKLTSPLPGCPCFPITPQMLPPFPERIAWTEEEIRRILPSTQSPVKPTP